MVEELTRFKLAHGGVALRTFETNGCVETSSHGSRERFVCPNACDETEACQSSVNQLLAERFRSQEQVANFTILRDLYPDSRFFRFGPDIICYGQCSSGIPATVATDALDIGCQDVFVNGSGVRLPFDPVQVVNNLRFERYVDNSPKGNRNAMMNNAVRNMYYSMRPFLPVAVRKRFQRFYFRGWNKRPFPTWPVDRTVERIFEQLLVLAIKSRNVDRVPFVWFWPHGARSCLIMTHDVETSAGLSFCSQLMDLNDSFGIKASFQIVPEERYTVTSSFLENIRERGFEVNVHDLNHDGHLFSSRGKFLHRAERINYYGRKFGAGGFRSAILYRNIDWYDALDFSYDMSVPNVAHLDPQPGGCCTVLPFFVGKIVELPVTATQDYSLFHILHDYSIRLWKQQIALIREKQGLISFIIHPDYITGALARRVYTELLAYLSELRSNHETWMALPGEVAAWWRMRNELSLVNVNGSWQIEGKGSERARIAYARLVDDKVVYEIDGASHIRRP
jgi:hypothetical protein